MDDVEAVRSQVLAQFRGESAHDTGQRVLWEWLRGARRKSAYLVSGA